MGGRSGVAGVDVSDVEKWLDYLTRAGRSPATIKSYRSTMRHYLPNPIGASVEDVESWWAAQDDKTKPTRQRLRNTVRSFYSWAIAFDLVERDPTRRIPAPHQGRRLPRPIGRTDLRRAMDAADPEVRRALALGAYAGLRISEAAALMWADIDLEQRRIYVRAGKGDKDRVVALGALLYDELAPAGTGSVVTGTDSVWSGDTLQRRVNRLFARLGIETTFHKLRARFATVALAESGNLLAVSRALGHASPATTSIYALTSDEDLDRISVAVER